METCFLKLYFTRQIYPQDIRLQNPPYARSLNMLNFGFLSISNTRMSLSVETPGLLRFLNSIHP